MIKIIALPAKWLNIDKPLFHLQKQPYLYLVSYYYSLNEIGLFTYNRYLRLFVHYF